MFLEDESSTLNIETDYNDNSFSSGKTIFVRLTKRYKKIYDFR